MAEGFLYWNWKAECQKNLRFDGNSLVKSNKVNKKEKSIIWKPLPTWQLVKKRLSYLCLINEALMKEGYLSKR